MQKFTKDQLRAIANIIDATGDVGDDPALDIVVDGTPLGRVERDSESGELVFRPA